MKIKSKIAEELMLKLQETLQKHTLQELAEAYGCTTANLHYRIAKLETTGLSSGSVVKLRKALDKLEKVEQR